MERIYSSIVSGMMPMAVPTTVKRTGLQISQHHQDRQMLLMAEGKLTVTTISQMEQAVSSALRSGVSSVILDLSGIRDADASGIGVLVKMYDQAFHQGVDLRFVVPPGCLAELIELARLGHILPLFPDQRSALTQRPPV
jgi:anti-anti-sigma factor